VCTALQIALVDLLSSWNIYPDSVTGHSSGEIAAAYASGALSMKDAISVAYYRGLLASQLLDDPIGGAMMAVGMSIKDIQPYLDRFDPGELVVACVNSPSSVTISGDALAVDALGQMLKDQPVFNRRLEVGVAYHSPHMEKIAEQYHDLTDHIQVLQPAGIEANESQHPVPRFFSSVTGTLFSPDRLNNDYWVSNLLGQVKFADSLRTLCFETGGQCAGQQRSPKMKRVKAAQKASVDCLVEIGPHSALNGPIQQIIRADAKLNSADIAYISILTRKTDAVSTSMGAAATLVSLNYPVNFEEINRPEVRRKEHTPELLMDLPAYSWNHTRSYWAEPRLSRMYRNRPTPRLDLIGAPDNMSCPFEPRWRNHLRTSELPWLLDHKIQGSIIFPAAGYLTIAIEAAKQLMETREDIHTYLLQEIKIKSALVLNETSAVELMVSLSKSSQDRGNLLDFHIYSISEDNNWTEHCTGLVGGQKHPSSSKDGAEEAGGYAMVPLGTEVHGISVIDVQSFYDKLQNAGLEYGPCFSNLTEARVTQDGTCFAELTAPDTRSMMPASFQHDLLIHPCTLDSIFHTVLAALPPGMGVEEGPVIPVSIEEMIISSGLNFLAGELMSVCTHVRRMPKKDVTACIVVTDCNDKKFETEPSLSIRGLQCARLGLPETASTSKAMSAIYNIDWKADSSFLTGDNASFLFDRSDHEKGSLLQTESEHYAADFIRAALEEVGPEEAMTLDSSHRRFWCYLQDVLERYDTESKPHFEEFDAAPVCHLLQSIGQNLVGIIQDRIDYSSVIQDDHSLDAFWDIFSTDASYQAVANYVALLGHKKPTLSILEFGVGTGQIAEIFLQALMKIDGPSCCAKYIFVHESASVLEQTSTQLEPWSDCVACKALYLDKSFTEQGFENNSFDVIILPHGLCTARSEQIALSNIHDLLHPSGCLITINPFDPKKNVLKNLLFSALHCLSADEFCLGQGGWTENQWTETLSDAQFTSVDAFAEQNSEKSHHFIVAKKQSAELSKAKISIISEDKDGNATKYLVSQFKKASCDVIVTDIHNVHPKDRICLILDVSKSSILVAPDSTELTKIKEIFMGSAGVLWVTKGGTIEPVNPDASLAFGFARTARAESGVKPIITLDLDARNPLSDARAAEVISGLLVARFLRGEPDDDTEYAERNGVMLIPRVLEDMNANKTIESIDNIENVSAHYFQHIDQPVRLSRKTNKPGFVSDIQMSELPMDYVGIKVHSFGLTRWDSSQDLRYWEMDDTLGLECSGVVYKVGAGVHDITIGDRVACLGTGTARSFYHDRLSAFQIIRDDMTLELASAIPLAYTTAYYAVNYLALIEVEELVLVHNAGSLFGQAIVDVCLLKQARVFAIVQKTTERDSLVAQYNIPGEHILGSGQVEFAKSLLRFTDGKKANTVFAFDDAEENELKSCTAPFGRLIQLRTDFLKTRRLSCPQNMSLSILNIFELYKERADLADEIWSKVARLFLQNRLKGPASINLYPVSHIHEAITTASAEQHAVVFAKPDDIVQVRIDLVRKE
jgi:acyl transferase domain-containing protein/NADPH:quinone reductase-like Zn-dependent oxidoreductase